MARTASEISKENKERNAALDAVHQQQMAEVGAKNAARTAAVLNAAGLKTKTNPNTYEVSTSGPTPQSVAKAKKQSNIERRTESDFAKVDVTSTAKKREQAQTRLNEYRKTDRYKQRYAEREQRYKLDQAAKLFVPGMEAKMEADPEEDRLQRELDQAIAEDNAFKDRQVIESDLEAITGLSNEERRQLEQYSVGQDVDDLDLVTFNTTGEIPGMKTQDQAQALFQKYGEQRVNEMAETLRRVRNAEAAQEATQKGQEEVNKGFWSGVGANAKSIPANIVGNVGGTIDYIKKLGRQDERFTTLDPNAIGRIGSVYTEAVRGQSAQNINDWAGGGTLGAVASGVYQGVMSTADSIAQVYLSGGAIGGAVLAATGSFSQTMAEASRQGATPAQAALLATATAGIEAASEKIPLDDLIRTAKGQNAASVLKNVLRQAGIEAATEEVSLLGSLLAEAAVLQENSDYQQKLTTLILQGVKPDEAREQLATEFFNEALNTALVAGVAGVGGGLTASYADAKGMFAEKQANNPELSKPKRKDVEKARADLLAKYGDQTTQEAQAAQAAAIEQDKAQAPKAILEAIENQRKDDLYTDRVAEYRAADIAAIRANPETMQWLKERGLDGNIAKALDSIGKGDYQLQQPSQAAQQPQPAPQAEQAAQPIPQTQPEQAAQQPQTAPQTKGTAILKQDAEAETNAVSKPLGTYPPEKQKSIRSYIQSVDQGIKNFVQQVKSGNKAFKRQKISDVSDKTAQDVRNILGIDVRGFTHNINTNGVQHILNRHGASGEHDTSMASDDDIARIGWVLDNYDSVEPLLEDGAQVYSSEFRDSNDNPAPQIRFVKKIDGSYYVVEAACENKYKKLWVQSAYLQKNNGDVTQAPAESLSANHETNAQSALASPSPTVSLPQSGVEVNDNSANSETTNEAESTPVGESLETSSLATPIDSASTNSIPEGGAGVNENSANAAVGQQTEQESEQPALQRDRVNSVRDQAIPVTDPSGRVVSEAAGNIYTSSRTPESFTESIRRLVNEGRVSHDVQTNEESLNKAAASIAEDGSLHKALDSIKEVAKSGRTGALDVAKGLLIYDELVNSNDPGMQPLAEDCFVTLSQLATNTGRPMQLFSLFRKMTPESQTRVLQNEVNREIEWLQKQGTVKKDYKANFDPELMDLYKKAAAEYQGAKSDDAKKAAETKMQEIQNMIYAVEASKMPTTFKAKWDAWRYMAMLGNVKTQVRNIAGNALMMPYSGIKCKVGAILEKGLKQENRTKSVFTDRELLKWAKSDSGSVAVKNALENSAKLGDSVKNTAIADNIKTFGSSWLGERVNDLQDVINGAVSGGDMFFKNKEYAKSLAGFLKARGYSYSDIQNNAVDQDVLNEARNYAVNEAMRATFNDSNMLSDGLANMRFKNPDTAFKKVANTLGEGLMPFRKTPANVLVRFEEYSPAGIINTLWKTAKLIRNGEGSAASVIDSLASTLTGTGAMMLGYALAGGLGGIKLTGSGTDEDEKRQGHQDYSIEFSVNGQQYSYKIDWASPFNLPLFLGANLREAWESEDTSSFYTAVLNMGAGALEPLLELSCMSSLNDLAEGLRYAGEGEAVYTVLSKMATSYFTQGVPSLARQAYQASQDYKQSTFVTSDDPVIQKGQKALAGLPGGQYKTDKINAWGEKEVNGEGLSSLTGLDPKATRVIDAFVNPGTLKKIDNSTLEQEITRLNQVQETNVTPSTAPKTVSYTDKNGEYHKNMRLTEEQYQTLATTQGQTAKRIVSDIIGNKNYNAMTDEQKAKAIDLAYSFAREKAEVTAIKDHTGYSQSWMMEMQDKKEADYIIRRVTNSELSNTMAALDTAWDNGYDDTGRSKALETAYDSYSKLDDTAKAETRELATGTAAKYIEVRDKGVDHETTVKILENIAKVKGTGKYDPDTKKNKVRDIDKRNAIATSSASNEVKDILMKAYMEDYDPNAETVKTTEIKYDYLRQEMGLTPAQYTGVYRLYLDNDYAYKQTISDIQTMYGLSRSEAKKIYETFRGWNKDKILKWHNNQ